jgi:hypothetical protein
MMNKFNQIKTSSLLLFVIFFLVQITPVGADDGQDIIKLPPHPDLGIVDINTGLETAHTPLPPGLGYKYLDANYQQALNLGTSWNRWKVDWSAVEEVSGQFTWVCQAGCAPGFGEYFDYPRLAQEDDARGINSLVILAEILSILRFMSRFINRLKPVEIIMEILPIGRRFFNDDFSKENAIKVFNQHNDTVQQTVPPERLLVYEVKQGWEPLCDFLEVPLPDSPFPHKNTREEFGKL